METRKRLVNLTVPGRYVVYPYGNIAQAARLVLSKPCTTPIEYMVKIGMTSVGIHPQATGTVDETLGAELPNCYHECSQLPSGMAFAIFYTLDAEHLSYLSQAYDSIRDWFYRYAEQIGPQFIEIREEIKRYIEGDYKIWPMPNGFIEWFMAAKIGGMRIEFTIPFDKYKHIINGGGGSITFDCSDLLKVDQCRINSKYLYEYIEYREAQEQKLRGEFAIKNNGRQSTLMLSRGQPSVNPIDLSFNKQLSEEEVSKTVREILAPLNGYNLQKERIMGADDFARLIQYTDYLVLNDQPPVDIKIIPQTKIAGRHITYTFRRLHERLFTTKNIRDSFIFFLMACFQQFDSREFDSFKVEFSKRPLKSYYSDLGIVETK